MPALVLFQRRWALASDDYFVPMAFNALLTFAWMLLFLITMISLEQQGNLSCGEGWKFELYLIGAIVIYGMAAFFSAAVALLSLRGTVMNAYPRRHIPRLIYVHILLFLIQIGWAGLGTMFVIQDVHCKTIFPDVNQLFESIVAMNWATIGVVLLLSCCLCASVSGGSQSFEDTLHWRQDGDNYDQVWERRLQCLGWCTSGANQHVTASSAAVLANFFRGLDVVPSDIAAAMVLINGVQRVGRLEVVASQRAAGLRVQSPQRLPESTDLDFSNPADRDAVAGADYFGKYMCAAYGWKLYSFVHLQTCGCGPLLKCCCCGSPADTDLTIGYHQRGTGCCDCWDIAALKRTLNPNGESRVEILFANLDNKVFQPSFYVALDHDRELAIIAIRGTLSLEDAFTDAMADAADMSHFPFVSVEHDSDRGCPTVQNIELPQDDCYGHAGFLRAAQFIKDVVEDEDIFQQINQTAAAIYPLVVLGHSLGAGVATVLALMMRPTHPELRCWAYSVPAVFSLSVAHHCKDFVISPVRGYDIITRVNIRSVELLRRKMLKEMRRSAQSKTSILCCGARVEPRIGGEVSESDHGEVERLLTNRDVEAPPSDAATSSTNSKTKNAPPMFPPGKMLHFVEEAERGRCCAGTCTNCCRAEFGVVWAENAQFDHIAVSATMVTDHLPDRVMDACRRVQHSVSDGL